MDDANRATGEDTGSHAGFRDPTVLTKWTRIFLYAGIAVALVSAWEVAGGLQVGGGEGSREGRTPGAIIWLIAEIAIGLTTAILVLAWIFRANHNARQLGAADMHFTPGWAVGWHFVPIAWFWKPYQAMREIWRASVNPSDWRAVPVSPLLPWWWGLWIVTSWVPDIVDWAASGRLDEAGAETLEAATALAGRVLEIPLALVLLIIIGAVSRMQAAHYRSRREA
ncbi:DUF4328 domain-containing protein [Candidatus Palauibacter sp.]|uniref:DUF4328 domain-containing protein n=1 Tax=Candidatus Palauibacter sp. TaxID=3101350 RepID=UPI003B023C18